MLLGKVLPYKGFRATVCAPDAYWRLVLIEIAQQFRDVTTLMQDTQNIDMVGALHVQDRIREVLQHSSAQPGNTELVAVARRTDTRVPSDQAVGGLQRVDQIRRGLRRSLVKVVVDRVLDIMYSLIARDDRLDRHPVRRCRMRARRPSK